MATYTRVVENLTLTSTMRLIGPEWDNTLVRNITIKDVQGDGIMIRDVSNLRVENVTIDNVTGDGIKLSTLGSTSDVVLANNTITNIGEDGINSGQRRENGVDHPGLQVIGNTIDTTGLNSGSSGLLHGMYIQSTDFLIEGNTILNSTDGNAISVRSSGVIRDNQIENTRESGVAYFADNFTGPSDLLVIENNTISNTGNGTNRTDINLLQIPNGQQDAAVGNFVIRNNTLSGEEGSSISVNPAHASNGADITITNNGVNPTPVPTDPTPVDPTPVDPTPIDPTPVEPTLVEPTPVEPIPETFKSVTVNATFEAGRQSRTVVEQSADNTSFSPINIAAQSQFDAASLSALATTLSATSANNTDAAVSVHAGRVGISSDGESMTQRGQINAGETLSFHLDDHDLVGDAFVFRAQFGAVDQGDRVQVTAYQDDVVVASEMVALSNSPMFFEPELAFDRIDLTPASGDSVFLRAFEADRILLDDIL